MTGRVVGLFAFPWRDGYVTRSSPGRTPLALYRKAVWYKANPRSEAYMKALFSERYPDGVFVNVDRDPGWPRAVTTADQIVLLFPDAIGLGFAKLEGAVRRARRPWAGVRALNGRRRDFLLSRGMARRIRLRRLLERAMLLEVAASVLVVLVTPFLLAVDLARGRR